MFVAGSGWYIVRHRGRSWEFIPHHPDDDGRELRRQILEILNTQSGLVCDDCRAGVIEPMIENAKGTD